jgi:hypothetical protein
LLFTILTVATPKHGFVFAAQLLFNGRGNV